jgi:hypothetical protein
MMDLLDRYLAAVRRNLPVRDAADITEELRDVLLARAEEREASSGSVDWPALLKEFGHPLTVAARYRQQQWLIGPELYPFYLNFLKVVGLIVITVVIVVGVVKGMLSPGQPGPMIAGLLGSLWWAIAASVGSVTIVFALIERWGGAAKHFQHWNPRQLPDSSDNQPKRCESAFEVGLGVLFMLWWTGIIHVPEFASGSKFRMEPAPIWNELFWPILILSAVRLVHNLIQWLRPRWRVSRGLLGIVTAVGGLIVAAIAYQAGHWVTVVPTGMGPDSAMGLQSSLDLALRFAIIAVAVIWALGCVSELWRLARSARGRSF